MTLAWTRAAALLAMIARPSAAQGSPPDQPGAGTLVTAAELTAAVERTDTGALADAMLRVLPVAGEYNVGISVVRRSQIDGRTPPDAIVHDAIAEVYHVLEGRGILVLGGTVDRAVALPPDNPLVREVIGPSAIGPTISGGARHQVGPGDVVVIPAHTAHGFTELQTPRVVYLLIRIDPHRVLMPQPR